MKISLSLRSLGSLLLIVSMAACGNNPEQREVTDLSNAGTTIVEDTETTLPALPYVAVFDETSDKLKAEKNPDFDLSTLSLERITGTLIGLHPEICPEVEQVSNDTVYIRIIDARHLTQRMGSSGALMYLLEATYAYTELPGIRAVHFSFEEGDHAIPGTYTRARFQ